MHTLVNQMVSFFFVSNICHEVLESMLTAEGGFLYCPRTAGGLSHLRTAGGGADTPENSKTKKDSDKR